MKISLMYQLRCFFLISILMGFVPGFSQPKYAPTGKLVDAGGHLLHIKVMGKGNPTVIMESGSGDFSFVWDLVQPQIAKITKTVSYDRAGYAWSEPGPMPRTGHQIAVELHIALQNAGIKPPYILVGQSFGGFLVRSFARYYTKEVVGMVLVDALNEDSRIVIGNKAMRIREWANGRIAPEPQLRMAKNVDKQMNTSKWTPDTTIEPPLDRLPPNTQKLQIWAQSQQTHRNASDSEMFWSPEDVANMYQHRGEPAYMLGDIPLIVISRGDGGYKGLADSSELESERIVLQNDLAKLSTNSKHIIDKNSGHNIHIEDPGTVIDAIKQVIMAVRDHKRVNE